MAEAFAVLQRESKCEVRRGEEERKEGERDVGESVGIVAFAASATAVGLASLMEAPWHARLKMEMV